MIRLFLVPCLLVSSVCCCESVGQRSTSSQDEQERVIRYYRDLPLLEKEEYVDRLAELKDFERLRIICKTDVDGNSRACARLVGGLPSREAIEYCTSLPIKSLCWQSAFHNLSCHPKTEVIGYVREIANSPDPVIRCFCYQLCLCTGWDDLRECAERDQYNQTTFTVRL